MKTERIDSERDLPTIRELGIDLLHITPMRRAITLALPFVCVALYLLFALIGWWPAAVATLIYLSFITYGSISHDLVHRNLGLRRSTNDLLLTLIELLAFRSGHAYRLAHLHHHSRFPHDDDIEGEAAKMRLFRALLEGVIFQLRIWLWSVRREHRDRTLIILEGIASTLLLTACLLLYAAAPIFTVYAVLMVMGSWIIPLITSYIPHDPNGESMLFQTYAFRGTVASVIAMEHLYHLEHHLYPAVPHHNWPELARRLDPYFQKAGVVPITLWL